MKHRMRSLRFPAALVVPAGALAIGSLAVIADPASAYNGKASLILHVAPPASNPCPAAPAPLGDVITVGASGAGGSARIAVYVLVAVPDPQYQGTDHVTFGIWYQEKTATSPGITVEGWSTCAPGEYATSEWPAPLGEITLDWGGASGGCETRSTFVAGWFQVDPEDPGTMALNGGADGSVWLAGCGLRSFSLDAASLGWVSFGGAANEDETDGCNPWRTPCNYRGFPPPRPRSWIRRIPRSCSTPPRPGCPPPASPRRPRKGTS
jgi:hypothetical protein